MNIEIIGTIGCILTATSTAMSFPVIVRIANSKMYSMQFRLMLLAVGLLTYCCLGVYAFMRNCYPLAFAEALGVLKYAAVLIQIIINKISSYIKNELR